MKYSEDEKKVLALMDRTDFKAISKNEVISIFSKIADLRPEVAKEVLTKYPEFVGLIKTTMADYRDELSRVIESDDESLKGVFGIADKEIDNTADARKEYYEFANNIREDISKCLENPDLTPEERKELIDREMDILKAVDNKDTECRNAETKIVDMVDRKDDQKRQFNWNLVKTASYVALFGVAIGFGVLGGNLEFKLSNLKA